MAKVRYAIPILAFSLREYYPVHQRLEQTVRPEMHQVSDVYENWWEGVGFCARRIDGDGGPG